MKKVIFAFAALVLVGTSACERCKDCTVTVKVNGAVFATSTGEICGDSLKDVDGETFTVSALGNTTSTSFDCK